MIVVVHTIPVPDGFTVEQAWEACAAGVRMIGTSNRDEFEGRIGWANVALHDDGTVEVIAA